MTIKSIWAEMVELSRINSKLDQLLAGQRSIMDALTDLQTAVGNLGTSITDEIAAAEAALTAALAKPGGIAAADVEAVVTRLTALRGTVDAETAKLNPVPPAVG